MLATCSCQLNCLETNRNFYLKVLILKHSVFSFFNGFLMIRELCSNCEVTSSKYKVLVGFKPTPS